MMLVRDIMTRNPETLPSSGTIKQAAEKMRTLDVGFIPVKDERDVIGLVTDRDIAIRAVAEGKDPSRTKVSEIMTKDVRSCDEETDVKEAARIMQENQIRRLVVRNHQGECVGILSLGDLAVDADERVAGQIIQDISSPSEPKRGRK